ncbi:MAG: pyridoxal phosphate-dependent aminotransferase [Rikenellaceae bacterium]|jgi:aspartate aminotransferase|nr:pyridoxal phosphate-dependent aminotransferase [Rikenellaceae bacterium]
MPQISERGVILPASAIRKLAPLADGAKARGIHIYHLNIGQPDIPTPQVGLAVLQHIDRRILEYSPSDGLPSVRRKFVEYYRRSGIEGLSPDEVIVTTGGSEALLFAFQACLDVGDEVIMTDPGYANYISFAMQAGVVVRPIPTSIDNGFALPPIAEFDKYIGPRTRAIILCNPNNPTGYLYSRQELEALAELVKRRDLFLISDEVYREFRYSDQPYISALSLAGIEQNVVMVDSVSKRYSECGIRIGTLVTRNKEVRAAVMKSAQARLSPPLLGQLVAEASIDVPEAYMKEVYADYIERRDVLIEGLNRIPGVYAPLPRGAFYTMAQLPVDDADRFCEWMLRDFSWQGETVMMAPGSGFYTDPSLGKKQVRIAYVLNKEAIARALVILEKALEQYPGREK